MAANIARYCFRLVKYMVKAANYTLLLYASTDGCNVLIASMVEFNV